MPSDWFEFAMKAVVVIGSLGVIGALGTVLSGWGKRLARAGSETGESGALRAEMIELHDQVQRVTGEMAELHERVDFAERVLARERDAERLKG